MPINPAIAMGVRGIELQDPLAQYGRVAAIQNAQQQNMLAQQQLAQARRAEEQQNALSAAFKDAYNAETGEINTNRLRSTLANSGFGSQIPAVEKTLGELATQRLTQQKLEGEVVNSRLTQSRNLLGTIDPSDPNAPAQYMAWHEANHRDPVLGPLLASRGVTAEQSRARIERAIQAGPEAFARMLTQSMLGVEEFAKQNAPKFFTQDIGGTTQIVSVPGQGGAATVVPGSVAKKSLTPGEAKPTISNIDVGGAILTQQYDPVTQTTRVIGRQAKGLTPGEARTASQEKNKVAHTTTDERGNVTLYNAFGEVITPKDATGAPTTLKGKPSAAFEKARGQRDQLDRDLGTAIAELNDITKDGGLIDQSTGSGAGRAVDVAAGFFGQATPGAIASAKLAPIADLVLKMVPRFEGPQSDKDTASYKQAAGQLADPNLPAAIRKEAGRTVVRLMTNRKAQFVTREMAAEGTGAGGGVDTSNPLLAPPGR